MMLYCWCFLLLWWWLAGLRHRLRVTRRYRCRHASGTPPKGVRPAPPRRRSGGRPKPRHVIEEVLRLFADTGSYRLAMHAFNRRHAHTGMTVCLNTVYTWVQKYRSEMEIVRRTTRNRFPRHAPPNLRWGLDATGKTDVHGKTHFILGILDHGTRLALTLKRLEHGAAQAILQEISLAIQQFGKPRAIRTDNAKVFRSAVFEQGLAALGIRHEFTTPGCPWQNGRIERLFLTLKQKLNKVLIEDGSELDRLLPSFRFWYNEARPHQHLHGFTPAEAWYGIDPYKTAPKAVLRFEDWGGLLTGFYLHR